jgi:hypothetical protein
MQGLVLLHHQEHLGLVYSQTRECGCRLLGWNKAHVMCIMSSTSKNYILIAKYMLTPGSPPFF